MATRPGAILREVALPGLDGHELAAKLRTVADFDDVLIVAITGYGRESDRAAGIDRYLLKPVPIEQILGLLGG